MKVSLTFATNSDNSLTGKTRMRGDSEYWEVERYFHSPNAAGQRQTIFQWVPKDVVLRDNPNLKE